jgi:hypothetical protein
MYLHSVECVNTPDEDYCIFSPELDAVEFIAMYDIFGESDEEYSFDFNLIEYDYENRNAQLLKNKEIKKKEEINWKYHSLQQYSPITSIFKIYRIPRTFAIAYNETHLISASMRANLYYLYYTLECKDIINEVIAQLYLVVVYDFSLYRSANNRSESSL